MAVKEANSDKYEESPLDVEFTASFLIDKTMHHENFLLRKDLRKALRKVGKAHYHYARELNTFMVAHGRILPEYAASPDAQEALEAKLREIHDEYVRRVLRKIRGAVWKDTEVSESRKAIERAQNFYQEKDMARVRQQIIGVQRVTYSNLEEVVSKTRLFFWEDPSTGACRLVSRDKLFSEQFPDLTPGEFGGLTDELTLLVFGQTFIRLLEPLLVNLQQIVTAAQGTIEIIANDLSGPAISKGHQEAVAECARVLLGKILGIRETLRSSQRQVRRFNTLAKEMEQTKSEVEQLVLKEMIQEYLDLEAVAERDKEVDKLNSMVSELIPNLRNLVSSAETRTIDSSAAIEAEQPHIAFIGDFYAELEKLRFFTDLWEDIPYFTLMPGGIAFETEEFEGLPRHKAIWERTRRAPRNVRIGYGALSGFMLGFALGFILEPFLNILLDLSLPIGLGFILGLILGLGFAIGLGSLPEAEAAVQEDTSISEDVVLKATSLFKTYRLANSTVYALRGVDFEVRRGEFVAITGTSGSGKTTLLNIISGLDSSDRGSVFLDRKDINRMNDRDLTAIRRDAMGFVFQYYNLLPVLTSNENVALPAELGGDHARGKELKGRVHELMEGVQLSQFGNQIPTKLSGGQMQRVTIARSMVNYPAILFADEPTGDLDSVTGLEIMKLIKGFHEHGSSIILVTHDPAIAEMAERIIELRDGLIIRDERLK
ncbi:MAG: ABC transporter ATP-binding protein [Candidatus Hodarchaeales archaeon]|jgi:putative ABC transport system ATP-binding protein